MTHSHTSTRIALVTGANRGLGRSSALHLAESGADVLITYRSHADEAAAVVDAITATGRRAAALPLDVEKPDDFPAFVDDVRAVLDGWGRTDLDVLVNNCGSAGWTPIGETTADEIGRLVAVHFTGVVLLTQALLPLLADGGRVVNTGTGLDRFTGDTGYSVYASVKGAVEVYTRYLAKALAGRRITVNTVAPGATGTDFAGGALRDNDTVRDALSGVIAMGRVGTPDDIGAAVAAIAAPGMSWVTGQRIEASGGMNL